MTADDLKPEQARRLMRIVGRELRLLSRLCRRMDRLGFVPDDLLYRSADSARIALQGLYIAAHYASCHSGVGHAPKAPAQM